MFYHSVDGHWWLGDMQSGNLNWNLVASNSFGKFLDGQHRTWIGDFTGAGHLHVMFYYSGDGHWWLGNAFLDRRRERKLKWTLVIRAADQMAPRDSAGLIGKR